MAYRSGHTSDCARERTTSGATNCSAKDPHELLTDATMLLSILDLMGSQRKLFGVSCR